MIDYKIRKLTEKECLRLMGYNDDEIDRLTNATDGNGKPIFNSTALYKFAGNSVIVDCFTAILTEVVKDAKNPDRKDRLDAWGIF